MSGNANGNVIGIGLFVALGLALVWSVRRDKRLHKQFLQTLETKGFSQSGTVPPALRQRHPYLEARQGPQGILFLLGRTGGDATYTGSGGSVSQVYFYQGFLVPAACAVPEAQLSDPARQKALNKPLIVETLPDGMQAFLWINRHEPKHLAKTLAAFDKLMIKTPVEPAAPAVAKAESAPAPAVRMRRYFVMAQFDADVPHLRTTVSGVYEWPADPDEAQMRAVLAPKAQKEFAKFRHPEAVPKNMSLLDSPMLLPEIPTPPPNDPRPLKRWKISANMINDDVKFGAPIWGVLEWPEKPSADIVDSMIYYLMVNAASIGRGHPGYANESRVEYVKVEEA